MSIRNITTDIYYIGVCDWDRKAFDALIPLPLGTSYNSYVIKGSEKIAIIDTVEPEKKEEFFHNLKELKLEKVDYIIADHAEQDHSGLIGDLLEMYPAATVVTNAKCKEFLMDFLLIPEKKISVVCDGETLNLGNKTLQFVIAPWVHWPDTMFTYVPEDKILFTTDFFGAHIADSSLFVDDKYRVYDAAKRYYAQIMMPFRSSVKTNLKKVEAMDINIIAPSHGQLYNEPEFIMNAYREWSEDTVKNEVVIPFVSMHGSTRKMVDYLLARLVGMGIKVKPYNLDTCDLGELAMATVDAATVVLGTPAVLVGAHPKAVYAAYLLNILRPKTRYISIIGSYGWGCKIEENIKQIMPNLKAELLKPVLAKGYPVKANFEELDRLAEEIYLRHKEAGLL